MTEKEFTIQSDKITQNTNKADHEKQSQNDSEMASFLQCFLGNQFSYSESWTPFQGPGQCVSESHMKLSLKMATHNRLLNTHFT